MQFIILTVIIHVPVFVFVIKVDFSISEVAFPLKETELCAYLQIMRKLFTEIDNYKLC